MTVAAGNLDEARLALSDQVNASGRGVAWRVLSVGVMVLLSLAGCANTVFHIFSFNAKENPGIEILDYQYGESRQPMARPTESRKRIGRVPQAVRMGGEVLRPDKLYVKWRVVDAEATYEQTVNLKRLLPRDIEDHEIHFSINGQRLDVYLISPKGREPGEPRAGPPEFQFRKVTTLWSGLGERVDN